VHLFVVKAIAYINYSVLLRSDRFITDAMFSDRAPSYHACVSVYGGANPQCKNTSLKTVRFPDHALYTRVLQRLLELTLTRKLC